MFVLKKTLQRRCVYVWKTLDEEKKHGSALTPRARARRRRRR